jgi:SanA protein
MYRNRRHAPIRWLVGGLFGALIAVLAASFYVRHRFSERVLPVSQVPQVPVALVFGAGLATRGEPSPVLAERIKTAVALYRLGKVQMLLLSGDDSERYHGETNAMRRLAQAEGLPLPAVLRDAAGLSTYDSCYRAKKVFGIDKAILVTQSFHLPRALFVANSLGIDAYGVAADLNSPSHASYELREVVASAWALVLVTAKPTPKSVPRE